MSAAVDAVERLLREWIGKPAPRFRKPQDGADLVVLTRSLRLVIEVKPSGDAATVARAADQATAYANKTGSAALPVVAVPYMGDVGKKLCSDRGVSWLDLSGNADLSAPGLRILVEGKPNLFPRRGRPSSVFAPKSARIARRLLRNPERAFRQHELANETGLDDGFTSRIVGRLEQDGLITRDGDKRIHVPSPDRLLDAWAESYEFSKHALVQGHVSARDGDELVAHIGKILDQEGLEWALTGLAGAWAYTQFADFRIATFFLGETPSAGTLSKLRFRETKNGGNVWLAIANDSGIFDGWRLRKRLRCVHPAQVYVDLQDHPERAKEAAEELRARWLTWNDK